MADTSSTASSTTSTSTNGSSPATLGPRDLMPQANSPFMLSKPEFVAVQTYVEAGKRLPASRDEMTSRLGISAEDVAEFDDLIAVYNQIDGHCTYFSTATFPMSVQLASAITEYNTKVPTYYGALNQVITLWQDGKITPDQGKAKLDALLSNLRDTAQTYATTAKTVKDKMIQFVEETKGDQANLTPVQQRYHDKYEAEGGLIDTYTSQIKTDLDNIKNWNDQYQHDVTVAATSATYAWVWPVGTIAAAIVAGIYGKRATDALDHVHEYQDKLAQAQGDLRKALLLTHDLYLANDSLAGIVAKLNAALPVLEKMEGIWGAIADDMANVLTAIDQDIDKAPVIIKDLGVTEAIDDWAKVAAIADAYRVNAYITVTTEDQIKANPQQYAIPVITA